jgi:hypothetical protein
VLGVSVDKEVQMSGRDIPRVRGSHQRSRNCLGCIADASNSMKETKAAHMNNERSRHMEDR